MPLVKGQAKVVNAELDQEAAYRSDEFKGRVYIITVQMGTAKLNYHVDIEAYDRTRVEDIVQIAYTESRLFHIVQLRDVHKASQ
ncbi:hypothetical protein HY230_09370 [Candidatus Acetothermia bacterium]|nr:hypothetical protein [Candidatus Acetothermia bacterium]